MKTSIYTILFLFLIGCQNKPLDIEINKEDITSWNKKNEESLHKCCKEFDNSVAKLAFLRAMNKDVRFRVLNNIEFKEESNNIDVFETYDNSNSNFISILTNKESYNFIYNFLKDSIIVNKDFNFGAITVKDKKKLIDEFNEVKCCELDSSHPSISFYTKLEIKNKSLKVIESHTR